MGDIAENDPEGIELADCAMLLGQPRLLLWLWSKFGRFASPASTKNGWPLWHEDKVYRWAARTQPQLIRRIPIRYWPHAQQPAVYHGAQEIQDAVVQTWKTDTGWGGVLWSRPELIAPPLDDVITQLPHADSLVRVQSDFGTFGPGLSTAQPGNPTEWKDFGVGWIGLARVLGQPVPYWPLMLRIPELITVWKPGAAAVTYPTIPEINTTPLLRLAATLPQDTPAYNMLLHLARLTQDRSTRSALGDLEILAQCEQRAIDHGRHEGDVTIVAAHPLLMPEVEAVPEQLRRAGWLQILAHTDQLSVECVREAHSWDGGRYFLFSNPEQIDPTTEYGAEWAARLEPTERTAGFAMIDPDERHETLWDKDSYWGLSWGYPGSGPGSLALLISRLLDNVTARGADNATGAPAGLEELTQIDWQPGTVFTRAQLEAARDGRPYTAE